MSMRGELEQAQSELKQAREGLQILRKEYLECKSKAGALRHENAQLTARLEMALGGLLNALMEKRT